MPKREEDKILFDSVRQRDEFAASLRIGSDTFQKQLLKLMADSMDEYSRAWNWLHDNIAPLAEDETLTYDFATRECRVVKTATKVGGKNE